jgi:hypothetical protein
MKIFTRCSLIIIMLIQFGCLNNEKRFSDIGKITTEPNICKTISKETAILIAKGQLFSDKASADFSVTVNETNDGLEVHFSSNCDGCVDGNPFIIIDKSTGEVIRVFRYGKPMTLK